MYVTASVWARRSVSPSVLAITAAFAAAAIITHRLRLETHVSVFSAERDLPVAYWLVVGAYSVAFAWAKQANLRSVAIATLGVGVVTQLGLLLSAANLQAETDPTFFDNRVFHLYFRIVLFTVLIVAGLLVGWYVARLVRQVMSTPASKAALLYVPVIFVFVYVLAELAATKLWAYLAAGTVAALVGGFREAVLSVAYAAWRRRAASALPEHPWVVPAVGAALLFGLVVAFNLALVRQLGPRFPLNFDDGDFYDDLGWAYATGTPYRTFAHVEHTWGFRSPGYPFFVALVYFLFSRNFLMLGVAQAFVGMLVPILVYLLGKRLFDVSVAGLAALLAASSGLVISILVGLRSEAAFVVVSVVLLWALIRAADSATALRRLLWLASSGATFAYGVLAKPQMLAFAPVMAAWLIYVEWRRHRPLQWVVAEAAVLAIAAAAVLAPVFARDVEVNGRLTIIGTSHANETWLLNYAGARLAELGITLPSLSLFVQVFQQRPLEVATVLVQEVPRNVLEYFIGPWLGKGDPILLQRYTDYARNMTYYAHALGLLGLVVGFRWRQARAPQVLVLAYVAVNSLVVIALAYPAVRYRIPLDPLLFLWVAAAAVWLFRSIGRATAELQR